MSRGVWPQFDWEITFIDEICIQNVTFSVRILASQETLFEFLKEQHIEITLFNGHELLGTTEVQLGSISFDEDIKKYFFQLPAPNSLVPFGGDEDVSPYLEVTKWLKTSTESR